MKEGNPSALALSSCLLRDSLSALKVTSASSQLPSSHDPRLTRQHSCLSRRHRHPYRRSLNHRPCCRLPLLQPLLPPLLPLPQPSQVDDRRRLGHPSRRHHSFRDGCQSRKTSGVPCSRRRSTSRSVFSSSFSLFWTLIQRFSPSYPCY
jgi:hypothetical protein